jgi:hypothetical protein
MSISLEPNKGLRLKLGRLSPIRTWHGGGNFWSHEFQLTVRSGALAGFLPRAIEDEDSVLFEYRSGGTEQASTSVAISSMSEIPAKELNALRAAVDELKRKAEDPHCDRTKRQMIEGFRLPDPQKDRDLYRLVGKGPTAKLIVLWGIEREEGSALAPGAAVDLMHTPAGESEAAAPVKKKSKLVPVLLLLALLSGGGWYFWHQGQEKLRLEAEAVALTMKNAEEARLKAEQERIAAFNAAAAAKAAASSTPTASTTPMKPTFIDPAKPSTPVPPSTISSDPKKSMTAETKSDSSKSTEPKKSTDSKSTTSTDSTKKSNENPKPSTPVTPATSKPTTTSNTTAIKPITAAPGTIVRNSSGVVTGVFGKDGKVALANPGTTVGKDGKVSNNTPGSVLRTSSGTCAGVCSKDGKVVPAKLGRVVEDAKGTLKSGPPGTLIRDSKGVITGVCDADGKVVPALPGSVLDKDGKIATSSAGTVFRDHAGVVTGVADADGKIVSAAPGAVLDNDSIKGTGIGNTAAAAPSGSVSTPMTSQGPPPAGISSLSVVSTSLSSVLGNGNVEVLLNVVARDNAGGVVNAPPINGWKVNGQLQTKPDGTPADGPVIPVSLPPGTHRISTVGRGADGQPFQTDADVLVAPKS